MIADLFTYSLDGLRRRKLRSWLTIIGIVIGITAFVLLVTIGQGVDRLVRDQLSFFADDAMTITPGGGSQSTAFVATKGSLTEKDWHAVSNIQGVDVAAPILRAIEPVQFKENTARIFLMAFTDDYTKIYKSAGIDMEEGRPFKNGETGVAVVGYTIANDFWGPSKKREVMQLGSRVILNNRSYTVIGIMKKSGGGLSSVADIGIYVPYSDGRNLIDIYQGNDQLTELDVKVRDVSQVQSVEKEIQQSLDNIHKVKNSNDRDYRITSAVEIKDRVGAITGALTLFLGGIALISLVIGAIGVANTMFMSVLERTREIGVLKAVGATDRVITTLFLLESGMIGAAGGFIAVVLSYVLVLLAVFLAANFFNIGLPLEISPWIAALSIFIAFVVGVASGLFPAMRAARLQAVEALRYE